MHALLQSGQRRIGRRLVQKKQRLAQGGRRALRRHARCALQPREHARRQIGRHGLAQLPACIGARQARLHCLAQIRLRQRGRGRIHGREPLRQRRTGRTHGRMQHHRPRQPAAQLPAHPQPRAHGHLLHQRGVEVEKAQKARAAAVIQRDQQLPPPAGRHFLMAHHALNLHLIALARIAQAGDVRFILIAQRQMQRQIHIAHQPQLAQRLLRRRQGLGRFLRGGIRRRE